MILELYWTLISKRWMIHFRHSGAILGLSGRTIKWPVCSWLLFKVWRTACLGSKDLFYKLLSLLLSVLSVFPYSPACYMVNNSAVELPQVRLYMSVWVSCLTMITVFKNNNSAISGLRGNSAVHVWQMVRPSTWQMEQKWYNRTLTQAVPSCFIPSFDSEVYVTVLPPADVSAVQAKTAASLTPMYSFSRLKLMSDPERIAILPVGMYAIKWKQSKMCVCVAVVQTESLVGLRNQSKTHSSQKGQYWYYFVLFILQCRYYFVMASLFQHHFLRWQNRRPARMKWVSVSKQA